MIGIRKDIKAFLLWLTLFLLFAGIAWQGYNMTVVGDRHEFTVSWDNKVLTMVTYKDKRMYDMGFALLTLGIVLGGITGGLTVAAAISLIQGEKI